VDTISKLLDIILLAWSLRDVSERELMISEQFGLRPIHTTSSQLSRLFGRLTRNSIEKWLTSTEFLNLDKGLETVCIDGLLYKLTLLNFRSNIVDIIYRTYELFFRTDHVIS
jgi:hypothetical protein